MSRVLLVLLAAWCALLAAGVTAQGALVLVAVGAVAWWCRRPVAAGRAVRHAHGHSPRFVATHEAGHAVVARKLGASGIWVRAQADAGQMDCRPTGNAVFEVAIDRAGRHAVSSGSGCGGDEALVRRHLRAVPARERARVRREGDRLARKLVAGNRGAIRSATRRIERTGRL